MPCTQGLCQMHFRNNGATLGSPVPREGLQRSAWREEALPSQISEALIHSPKPRPFFSSRNSSCRASQFPLGLVSGEAQRLAPTLHVIAHLLVGSEAGSILFLHRRVNVLADARDNGSSCILKSAPVPPTHCSASPFRSCVGLFGGWRSASVTTPCLGLCSIGMT